MASRTTEDVRHEIESEREALEDAVVTLRRQADDVRRKLPYVAAAAVAIGVAAAVLRRRVFRD